MKIIFLCGSLEPGRDGVGDYTRRLCGEIIAGGYTAIAIALNDTFTTVVDTTQQYVDNISVSVVRFPSIFTWKDRIYLLQDYLDTFKPHWISLQYVLYAYQPKGLPFLLGNYLKNLKGAHHWHIMFHELWVGKEDGKSLKIKLLSILQQYIIRQMIKTLQPAVIHTHLPAYKTKLASIGYTAAELPLFSNIKQAENNFLEGGSNNTVSVAFFSQAEALPLILQFLEKLQQQVSQAGKSLKILLLGGSVSRMKVFAEKIQYLQNEYTTIYNGGFLSPEGLSSFLSSCTLGITPMLRNGLGKSGSVAAFLEHGIPVAVPIKDSDEMPFFDSRLNAALLTEPDLQQLAIAGMAAKKARALVSLTFIAQKFVADLSNV